MINTSLNQFKEDQFTEKLLTLEYKQLLLDRETVPSIEIIKSDHISRVFLEKCYTNALDLLDKKKSLLASCYKYRCSDLSKTFPKEIVSMILQLYCKVYEEPNLLSFKEFHVHGDNQLRWEFYDPYPNPVFPLMSVDYKTCVKIVHYISAVREKKDGEFFKYKSRC